MRPQGVAIAILNMAVWMRTNPDATIEQIRIAVGPGGPIPFRAHEFEDYVCGRRADAETLQDAAQKLLDEIQLRTSPYRATEAYRQHLIATLLGRAFARIANQVSK